MTQSWNVLKSSFAKFWVARHCCSIRGGGNLPKTTLNDSSSGQPLSWDDGSPCSQDCCSHQQMFGAFKEGRSTRAVSAVHTQTSSDSRPAPLSAQRRDLDLGMTSHSSWRVPFECGGRGKHTKKMQWVCLYDWPELHQSQWDELTLAAILLVLK